MVSWRHPHHGGSPQHTTDPGISYHSRVNDSQNRSETCFPNPSPGKTAWSTWVLLYSCCFLETALLHTNHSWRVLPLSPYVLFIPKNNTHVSKDGKKMEQVFIGIFWVSPPVIKGGHWNYTLHMAPAIGWRWIDPSCHLDRCPAQRGDIYVDKKKKRPWKIWRMTWKSME